MCGSGIYRAPEISLVDSLGSYDGRAADVYSIGVCMFVLIRGCFPFSAEVPIGLLEQWASHGAAFQPEPPPLLRAPVQRCRLPETLLLLLDELLSIDASARPPASAVLDAEWLRCSINLEEASDDGMSPVREEISSGYETPPGKRWNPARPAYLIDERRKRRKHSDAFEADVLCD
eukprot:1919490-Prymnesium_polylepis.1